MGHPQWPALLLGVLLASLTPGCQGERTALRPQGSSERMIQAIPDGVVVPGPANQVQLRFYTNAAAEAERLFNTFDLEAFGQVLLRGPACKPYGPLDRDKPWDTALHHILIDGTGPELAASNSMSLIDQATGPEWHYLAWDLTAAYRSRVTQLRRALVYVEPDLFVWYDRVVAPKPISLQVRLHPPAATAVDAAWGDLRLELPRAGVRIHSPAPKGFLRTWKRIDSPADALLPGTVTMQLGPTSSVRELDLLTVLVVYRPGPDPGLAFKLLESQTALGARIHRQGLPTVVAFRTDPTAAHPSLSGFGFTGSVGVGVFKPKPRSR